MSELTQKELIKLLLSGNEQQINQIIEDVHPEDLLDAIRSFDGDKSLLLVNLTQDVVADIIDQADDEEKYSLLEIFSDAEQREILNDMSSDELVDLIGTVTPDEANKILAKIDEEEAEEVRELLSYQPDTAGGIMATEFVAVKETMTVGETLKYLQKEAPEAETAYYIFVLDEDEKLKGVLSLRDIVVSNFEIKIADIMNENALSIPVHMDQEEAGHIFEKYGFSTMPVVDENNVMLGIITVDDIMEILRDENTEDIYRLAGLTEGERVAGPLKESVKRRLPWLFVNLLTALLAASTVSLFESTIQKVVSLAVFMPIVAGMGGNTGTQTLTIIVRGIALGELTYENSKKILFKEIGVGLSAGIAIGFAVALLGYWWEKNIYFGLVIGLAMLFNLSAATLAGYIVPVTLKKLNIDPALASAVFVTTVTDVCGFFFFLGLATLFIKYLI